MIHESDLGAVRLLRMAHGKVQALDLQLFHDLRASLTTAERDGVRAVVITGSGTTFSAGVDLFRILDGGPEYVAEFLPLLSEVFVQWFGYARPMVAAINGHAIAGGAILAWCADWRIMGSGSARIGIPELPVGVPFPLAALEIARGAVPRAHLHDLFYRGRTFTPEDARASGLVDEVVAPEALLERAVAVAEELVALPPAAFRLAKEALRRPVLDAIAHRAAAFDPAVLAEWQSPETAGRIRAHLERTVGRKP